MDDGEIQDRLLEAFKKAEEDNPDGNLVTFTKPQAQALLEVAKWWIALRGVSLIGGALGSAVKWFVLIIGAWIALKAGVIGWIADNIGGTQ